MTEAATHATTPVEHRANFYTLGPRLLELRHLWDAPRRNTVNDAKRQAAAELRVARRRHKYRMFRGRHVPRPYMTPEEWVREKAAEDVTALVGEELERHRIAGLALEDAAATETAADRLAAGESGGQVLEELLAQHDETDPS